MAGKTSHLSSFEVTLFSHRVEEGTGIPWLVVVAWLYLENGPTNNPLNISPGGRVANYGSLEGAIQATIELLKTPRYAPIRSAARSGGDRAVLAAIARSGWATDPQYRTKLTGTYVRAKNDWTGGGGIQTGLDDIPGAVGGAVQGAVLEPVERAVTSAEEWLERKAKVTLAYVGLTTLALVLAVLGLELATGIPSGMAGKAAAAKTGGIPF